MINTKVIMIASAGLMGMTGIIFIFLPDEILKLFGVEGKTINTLLLQIFGTLYFSFAILNWLANGNLIGGIYSNPVTMGNFAHFFIGGLPY